MLFGLAQFYFPSCGQECHINIQTYVILYKIYSIYERGPWTEGMGYHWGGEKVPGPECFTHLKNCAPFNHLGDDSPIPNNENSAVNSNDYSPSF